MVYIPVGWQAEEWRTKGSSWRCFICYECFIEFNYLFYSILFCPLVVFQPSTLNHPSTMP